jgi:DNA-binding transcriptional MocR family regulator
MNQSSKVASLIEELSRLAEAGRPGDRLPTTRELAARFHASPVTVSRAISELAALRIVRTEVGSGTFVAPRQRPHDPDYSWQVVRLGPAEIDARRVEPLATARGSGDLLPLSWGFLAPDLQAGAVLARAGARAFRRTNAWEIAPPEGAPELRRLFAASLGCDADDVLVVPGSQSGIGLVMRTLANPGEVVLMESPTYPGAVVAAQSARLRPLSVPVDEHGLRADLLDRALDQTGARLVYLQPAFANPTGISTSPERRAELVRVAQRYGAFLIEDDWACDLGIDAPAPKPLFGQSPDGHVITIRSLSKIAAPSMRIGAIFSRGPVTHRLRAARAADDACVPAPLQAIASELLAANEWGRHVRAVGGALAGRRDALLRALADRLPGMVPATRPAGGLHLWLRLPSGVRSADVVDAARHRGALVGDGAHYFTDEAPGEFVRLSYGAATEAQLDDGVRVLAAAVEEARGR